MNIETKTVRKNVEDYLKFGWERTRENRIGHARHHYTEYILSRDKDMPNYDKIVSLESRYFSLKAQIRTYEPMDPLRGLISFVCFIIPFVIYAIVKNNQKKSIDEHNARIHKKMNEVLNELKNYKNN